MKRFDPLSNITITQLPDEPLVHSIEKPVDIFSKKVISTAVIILIAGIASGFILSSVLRKGTTSSGTSGSASKVVVGEKDGKNFKDSAEGQLETGGINGEGTHKLIRPGGENQTVYLTSSLFDLNQFAGKKVRVWGETFAAKKAGWLMDVGKVEVLQ